MRCRSEKCRVPSWPHNWDNPPNENGERRLVGCYHRDPKHPRDITCSTPCPMGGDAFPCVCTETIHDVTRAAT